jgi:hypothetical protein
MWLHRYAGLNRTPSRDPDDQSLTASDLLMWEETVPTKNVGDSQPYGQN